MRILLSYVSETDLGEGQHVHRVLERLGHEVCPINAARTNPKDGHASRKTVEAFPEFVSIEELQQLYGRIDLFLYVEPFGLIPFGINAASFPTACIIGDTHRDLPARITLARFFDHVFLYQRNHRDAFTEHPAGHVHWLPYACDLTVFRDLNMARDLDVAFVGKVDSARSAMLEQLGRRWRLNEQRYYLQHEIPEVYSRAKIVVNVPVGGDLNFRVFEALSCGAMLLTQRAPNGQETLFQEGVHYAGFDDDRELIEKVTYYLEHDEERCAIAAAGRREVEARHSLDDRLKTLVSTVAARPEPIAPVRRGSSADVDRAYGNLYAAWASVEASLALLQDAKRAGRPWIPLGMLSGKAFARRLYRAVR